MTDHALLPSAALFDVTARGAAGRRAARTHRARAHRTGPNKRRDIDRDSIALLAGMLTRTGQLVPCIGYRPDPDQPRVVLYAGQRRLLAARASHELAGTPEFDGLAPDHRA